MVLHRTIPTSIGLRFDRRATAHLGARGRRELARFVRSRTGDAGCARRFLWRVRDYPEVATARDGRGLAAFALIDRRRRPRARDLLYMGPTFSRDGAYVRLFAHLVTGLLEAGRPFRLGAEIANPRVLDDLSALLPTRSYPASPNLAWQARLTGATLQEHLPHVRGFDEATLTTAAADGEPVERYRLIHVGWDGSASQREALQRELARGGRR